MIGELCGQNWGGLGWTAACPFNQSHRCILVAAHEGQCRCECHADLQTAVPLESNDRLPTDVYQQNRKMKQARRHQGDD